MKIIESEKTHCPNCGVEMQPRKNFINMKECPECGYRGNPVSSEWFEKYGNRHNKEEVFEMAETSIEWATASWNPVTGCTKISEGCQNCYAERMSKRLAGRYGYPKDEPFKVTNQPDRLHQPGDWKKPKRIFVCSMSDIFHDDVEWNWLFSIFQIAGMLPRHQFLFLTKRPERAEQLLNGDLGYHLQRQDWCDTWPIPNILIGTTAENQKRADERIPILLQIPAAARFVSVEPMLGPVDIDWSLGRIESTKLPSIDWVICGGESGPGARPMHPEWAASLAWQCIKANVPFFFKQWGEWEQCKNPKYEQSNTFGLLPDGSYRFDQNYRMKKVGKKKAGRMLSGETWDQYPA